LVDDALSIVLVLTIVDKGAILSVMTIFISCFTLFVNERWDQGLMERTMHFSVNWTSEWWIMDYLCRNVITFVAFIVVCILAW